MNFENLKKMLFEAYRVHKTFIRKIDFNIENKAHAIYLIQGGALTATANAYTFNLGGYYLPTQQQKRFIDEAINLIWFFDENPDTTRQISAWFRNEVVERTPGNKGNLSLKQRAKINFTDEYHIQEIDKSTKKLIDYSSTIMHPTLKAVRLGLSKSTHIFDYDNLIHKRPLFNVSDFGNMFIIPALYSLLIPFRTFPLLKSDFDRLREYISIIEIIK